MGSILVALLAVYCSAREKRCKRQLDRTFGKRCVLVAGTKEARSAHRCWIRWHNRCGTRCRRNLRSNGRLQDWLLHLRWLHWLHDYWWMCFALPGANNFILCGSQMQEISDYSALRMARSRNVSLDCTAFLANISGSWYSRMWWYRIWWWYWTRRSGWCGRIDSRRWRFSIISH